MTANDDPVRSFRIEIFGTDMKAPPRVQLEELGQFMQLPVDAHLATSHNDRSEYTVHWLAGRSIGTWQLVGEDDGEITCSVRPVSSLVSVELGAEIIDEMLHPRAVRWAVLKFGAGGDITVRASTRQAGEFIDAVLAMIR